MKLFITNLFQKARIAPNKLRVALVNYGSKTNILADFNKYTTKPAVRKNMRSLRAKLRNSKAYLGKALRTIRSDILTATAGSRLSEGVPTAIIIIADAPATRNRQSVDFVPEVEALKQAGVTIFGVGIGKGDNRELQSIASQPSDVYYQGASLHKEITQNKAFISNIVARARSCKFYI